MTQFSLITYWHLDAAIERVWEVLVAVDTWPRWWRYVREVVKVEEGDINGVGSLRRWTWSSRLPYRLTFEVRTTAIERPTLIEGIAVGDLNGIGRWRLHGLGKSCCVRYEWAVGTGKTWMNRLGPLLAPVFEWNHNQVMFEGGRGLARHLGVALLAAKASSAGLRGLSDAKYDA